MTLHDELLLHFSAQTSRARPFHWWNGSKKAAGEVSEIEILSQEVNQGWNRVKISKSAPV